MGGSPGYNIIICLRQTFVGRGYKILLDERRSFPLDTDGSCLSFHSLQLGHLDECAPCAPHQASQQLYESCPHWDSESCARSPHFVSIIWASSHSAPISSGAQVSVGNGL
uniref:Uncharacterized protein n=1 Tax=Cacopsylla melanoneura TaxID=428564 RepID=A0A8D8W7W0_9HEMI